MTQTVYVGCDPEVFMFKNGKPVSAHGAIPGNKKEPHKVKDGAVQVDGMALEFNIDPALDAESFTKNITSVMSQLKLMVPDYELVAVPVAEFGAEYIAQQPEEAKMLGCEPDYNAYTMAANPRPNADAPFRTGAGHVHIGWNHIVGVDAFDPFHPDHMEACSSMVKELDLALGLGSLYWDKDQKRRSLYGDMGAFRPKPYGVEYRTLSNAWLKDERLMKWVFDTVQKAFTRLVNGHKTSSGHLEAAKLIFSNGNANRAGDYLRYYGYDLPPTVI